MIRLSLPEGRLSPALSSVLFCTGSPAWQRLSVGGVQTTAPTGSLASGSGHQLAQHIRQDAAVAEVIDLDRGIDPR